MCWADFSSTGLDPPTGLSRCLSCVTTGFNNVFFQVNSTSCGCGKVNVPLHHIHQLLCTGLQSGASGEVQSTCNRQGNCVSLCRCLFWSLVDMVTKRSLWSTSMLMRDIVLKYPGLSTPNSLNLFGVVVKQNPW